jgi:hypothetical protein
LKTRQIRHEIAFNPLTYLANDASDALQRVLIAQNVSIPMKLQVLLRKNHWALEAPRGVFRNHYRDDASDLVEHLIARDKLLETYRKELCAANEVSRARVPWTKNVDMFVVDDRPFYTLVALQVFAEKSNARSFFTAAATFIHAANNDFSLIRPERKNITPFTPHAARVEKFGRMVRGPAWTPEEDFVVRRWFGQRTVGDNGVGKHQKLSEEEWGYVLEALQGRRTRQSVHDRITTLNKQLLAEMAIDGYVSRTRLAEYMSRVLGERPHRPRMYSTKPRRRRRHDPTASPDVPNDASTSTP